ncbi:helix-turn-helix domain-containing protein [Kitasatospora sp. NPDC057500]|uniref:helix-turn-helix domain-containing protein n=1 Tax=Kitasatospora sp. NPDC057500 TaxID=3346151 RepID=UPI0036880B0F
MTQAQLGAACGLSQSAVSRLEKRGSGPYAMDVLLRVSRHLDIPPAVLGLAAPPMRTMRGGEYVERRRRSPSPRPLSPSSTTPGTTPSRGHPRSGSPQPPTEDSTDRRRPGNSLRPPTRICG